MPAFSLRILGLALAISAIISASPTRAEATNGQYADVNGLHMYYEVHGKGTPLLLIHGGLCTIEVCFGSRLCENVIQIKICSKST